MSDLKNKDTPPKGVVDGAIFKLHQIFDQVFPPAQREKWWSQLKEFAVSNPKITVFFTITVFLIALLAGLLIGLLGAVLFTIFMVLVALFVVLPTLFLTTFAATFLALWGLGGYYIIKWFNEGKTPGEIGSTIGDKLSGLTGGSLNWLMDSARSTLKTPKVQETVSGVTGDGNGISTGKFSESADSTTKRVSTIKDSKPSVPGTGL